MIRCISFLVLSVLVPSSAIAAELANTPPQQVKQDSKADNLLLSEIPQIVTEWTLRCTNQEAVQDPNTRVCWTGAASALTRYTKGLNESLIKQVEQLQADWLERAAQLKAAEQKDPSGDVMSGPVAIGTLVSQALPRKVLPKSASQPSAARKKVTQSATQSKFTFVTKRSQTKKHAQTIKLVPSKKDQRQALRVIQKSKTRVVVPVAMQRPIEASRYPSRKTVAEKQAIRDQLRMISKKVDCSTLICALSKKHKQ
jgi:hypothetical protein